MASSVLSLALFASTIVPVALSFPFIMDMPGVDTRILSRSPITGKRQTQADCPFNPVHPGAAPFNSRFPYTGARNGLPGTQIGGIEVPNDNDTAHFFQAPGPNDIRGPCPGLNTAANHHVRVKPYIASIHHA